MGTGELTDSLAFDPVTRLNEFLIRHALRRNMILEIKTKTDFVDHLPGIPKRNILVSWSLNPQDSSRIHPLSAKFTYLGAHGTPSRCPIWLSLVVGRLVDFCGVWGRRFLDRPFHSQARPRAF
jgi:hypothetical protein